MKSKHLIVRCICLMSNFVSAPFYLTNYDPASPAEDLGAFKFL